MIYLLSFFIALQVGDGVSTWLALHRGKGSEGNPVVRWVIGRIGLIATLILMKSAAIAGGMLLARVAGGQYLLGAMSLAYAWVVWNNLRIAFRQAS